MEKSPLTDKTLGILHNYENHRFSEVRQKAQEEWEDRHIKGKRKRRSPVPKYKIDQEIVLARGGWSNSPREYILIKVVDFEERYGSFGYYGIVLKVSNRKMLHRVGRLVITGGSFFEFYPVDVSPEKTPWVEE